jgi:probable phosphoglycerate mutase
MRTRVFLVRHGATVSSAEDRFAGATDVELSREGMEQAERLAARLAGEPVVAVYTSPLKRAVSTATILARPHGVTPLVREALREMNHGRWEGLRRSEIEARYPEEFAMWESDPFTFAPEGGEPGVAVMARALPVLREIVERHAGRAVAVVSHKATIRLMISSLLGMDPRGYRDRLDQSPACLNVLDFKDAVHARLMLLNDTSHYAPNPRPASSLLSPWWDGIP